MVPYKKVDLVVEVFAAMQDKKLAVVIGDGLSSVKSGQKQEKMSPFGGTTIPCTKGPSAAG